MVEEGREALLRRTRECEGGRASMMKGVVGFLLVGPGE